MRKHASLIDLQQAVAVCVELVQTQGDATFMDLVDELEAALRLGCMGDATMTVGIHMVSDARTMTPMSDPPNVVLWNCGTTKLIGVIEAMLAQEPRIVLQRTTVKRYQGGGMILLSDYDHDYACDYDARLPAIDFGDEIDPEGYDTPHWLPVLFVWAATE